MKLALEHARVRFPPIADIRADFGRVLLTPPTGTAGLRGRQAVA